jgi:glycosyltransferase involved in cell wall biosynthesis
LLPPLVSVCITAYNIEKYISECIESILRQKVNFSYEIIIGDDCSTDGTLQICENYQRKHPNIRIIKHEQNVGIMPNTIDTLESSNAKYIALMDGDDVWIDEYKLQKQIDFLESNPDYVHVFHDAHISDASLNYQSLFSERYPHRDYVQPFSAEQVVKWRVIGTTSSYVFRNYNKPYPKWGRQLPAGPEVYLFLLALTNGNIKYLPDIMSVYRVRKEGFVKSTDNLKLAERNIKEYVIYKHYFRPKLRLFFIKKILRNYSYIIFFHLKSKDFKAGFNTFIKLLVTTLIPRQLRQQREQ